MTDRIAITVNETPINVPVGCSVAAVVMQVQGGVTRQSPTGQPRGPLCGMGVCFECRLTIDGVEHRRSCQTPCQEGMQIQTGAFTARADSSLKPPLPPILTRDVNVLVVGAGPAGIAAACCAAEAGSSVGVVDDNPHAGGQIWRQDFCGSAPKQAAPWLSRLGRVPIEFFANTQILGSPQPSTLLGESPSGVVAIRYRRLILACGARERFLPFPGWTFSGVFGAGGLQALVKAGLGIEHKKVVIAGSGPLLLAVAAYLQKRGAKVRLIAEQTPRGKLWRFAGSLGLSSPGKLLEAMALRWQLRGISYRAGCWPIRADGGGEHLESVTLTDGKKTWTEPCDALACGFGLVPNLDLAMLLECKIAAGFVEVDALQQTSTPGTYAVGELSGIGGLDKALLEGQIAGWSAAGQPERGHGLLRQRDSARQFVTMLDRAFALRDELRHLADKETIVCRCEDVTLGSLKRHGGWRDAKLQTRCGMGACQGRLCGSAVQFLFGWDNDSIRPPLFPTALANLAAFP